MFSFNLILIRPVQGVGCTVSSAFSLGSHSSTWVYQVLLPSVWHRVFLKIRMESSPLVQSTLISLCIYSLHHGTVTAAKFPVRVSSYRLVQAPVVLGTAWGCFCLLMTFILSFPFGSMTASHCLMGNILQDLLFMPCLTASTALHSIRVCLLWSCCFQQSGWQELGWAQKQKGF